MAYLSGADTDAMTEKDTILSRLSFPVLLVLAMAMTGCAGLEQSEPELDPEAEPASDTGTQTVSRTETGTQPREEPVDEESEDEEAEASPEPEHEGDAGFDYSLQWDEAGLADTAARLSSMEDVALALSALHRSASGAFMEPVIEYVEGEMGLDLGQGEATRTHACPDGGTFTHEWLEGDGQHPGHRTVLYEFEQCRGHFRQDDPMAINGAFARSFEPVAAGDHVHLTFDVSALAETAQGSEELQLRGRQERRHPEEGGVVRRTSVLELKVGDEYIALSDFREEMSVVEPEEHSDSDFPAFSSRFETGLEGRLISSELGGSLAVSTPKVLADRQPPCAALGVLRFESDRRAEVRYGSDTGIAALVSVELDNQLLERYATCDDFAQELGFDAPWHFPESN